MKVVVDACIWSLVLRRRKRPLENVESLAAAELAELIREGRVQMIGPIRQELLSGISRERQYAGLRDRLRAFADEPLGTADYEEAARIGNLCRAHGVSGSPVDFVICAVASRRRWQIFSSDADFRHYARYFPLPLYEPRVR
jgi:predicted nucleic acid-binding protein